MIRFTTLFFVAVAAYEEPFDRPVKIARECKSEVELFCKGVRPGGSAHHKLSQGKGVRIAAFKSTE